MTQKEEIVGGGQRDQGTVLLVVGHTSERDLKVNSGDHILEPHTEKCHRTVQRCRDEYILPEVPDLIYLVRVYYSIKHDF